MRQIKQRRKKVGESRSKQESKRVLLCVSNSRVTHEKANPKKTKMQILANQNLVILNKYQNCYKPEFKCVKPILLKSILLNVFGNLNSEI